MFPFWIAGVFLFLSGIVITMEFHMMLGFLIIFAGAVTMIAYKMLSPKFPVDVQIFLRRHGTVRIGHDKATRLKYPDGSYYYKLRKLKDELPATEFKNLYPSGSREKLLLYSPAPGQYHPCIFKDTDLTVKFKEFDKEKKEYIEKEMKINNIEPIPDDSYNWMVLKQQRMKQKFMHQSMWDRYYPIFVVMILAFSIMFVVYGLFNAMEPTMDAFREAAAGFRSAAQTNAEVTEKLGEIIGHSQSIEPGSDLPAPPDVG